MKYVDKNGVEIHEGDFIKLNENAKPEMVYEWEDEYGHTGLGTDATNPYWIETGRAYPCEYGIYPLDDDDLSECVVVK